MSFEFQQNKISKVTESMIPSIEIMVDSLSSCDVSASDINFSTSEAKERYLSTYGKLSQNDLLTDDEATEAEEFSNSSLSERERGVTLNIMLRIKKGGGFGEILDEINDSDPQVVVEAEKLIGLQGVEETVAGFNKKVKISPADLARIFVNAYSSEFNVDELGKLYEFHSSSAGKKCQHLARQAGLGLIQDFGL